MPVWKAAPTMMPMPAWLQVRHAMHAEEARRRVVKLLGHGGVCIVNALDQHGGIEILTIPDQRGDAPRAEGSSDDPADVEQPGAVGRYARRLRHRCGTCDP